jgi:hypothetical protein
VKATLMIFFLVTGIPVFSSSSGTILKIALLRLHAHCVKFTS